MEIIKKVGNETIEISQDTNCESPRLWDNLSTMIFFGNHKHLGDSHDIELPSFNSRQDFIEGGAEILKKKLNVASISPVHLYSHSGTCIGTSDGYPFNCPWDSGTIGFVVVTKEDIRENWNIKRVTKQYIQEAQKIANSEVEVLNYWISGEVYSYTILDEDENIIDSCGGFFGDDMNTNGMKEYIDEKFHNSLDIEVGE